MTLDRSLQRKLVSRPLRLHWAGWETDTYRLQQGGWQLSADQDVAARRMRLMMQHSAMRMQALTDRIEFDYWQARDDWGYADRVVFPCRAIGSTVHVQMAGSLPDFRAIDAAPQWREASGSLDDLFHFAPTLVRTQEIILPDESVPELMERILKLQQPGRTDRLREELRNQEDGRDSTRLRQKFHAQIISIAA